MKRIILERRQFRFLTTPGPRRAGWGVDCFDETSSWGQSCDRRNSGEGNEERLAERPVCVLLDAACVTAESWRVSTYDAWH